jgi:hypothetical protein
MKHLLAAAVSTGLLIALPVSGTAQNHGTWSLSVNPRFGYSIQDKPLGALAPGGPVVEMPPAAAAGVGIEIGTPSRWVSVRFTVLSTFAEGLNRRSSYAFWCGESVCTALGDRSHPLKDGGSVLNLSGDLVVRPALSFGRVQPYAVAGAGLKRYDLGDGAYDLDLRYRYGGRSAGAAVNLGGGIECPVGHAVITLEAVDYMSGLSGRRVHEYSPLSERAFNGIRHDVVFSVGLRVDVLGGSDG